MDIWYLLQESTKDRNYWICSIVLNLPKPQEHFCWDLQILCRFEMAGFEWNIETFARKKKMHVVPSWRKDVLLDKTMINYSFNLSLQSLPVECYILFLKGQMLLNLYFGGVIASVISTTLRGWERHQNPFHVFYMWKWLSYRLLSTSKT